MCLQLAVVCAVAVVCNAGYLDVETYAPSVPYAAAPVVAKHVVEQYDPNPGYQFSYGVSDPHTGDYKTQEETLSNGVVHGRYSLLEPDGSVRVVTYVADKLNGFNAHVEKHQPSVHH